MPSSSTQTPADLSKYFTDKKKGYRIPLAKVRSLCKDIYETNYVTLDGNSLVEGKEIEDIFKCIMRSLRNNLLRQVYQGIPGKGIQNSQLEVPTMQALAHCQIH